MGSIVSGITDAIGITDTGAAGEASMAGTQTAAAAQREGLEYLKETEKLPQALREAGLTSLGGEYGLTFDEEGNVISDGTSLMDRAKASPFYEQAVQAGEEGVLRHQAATGGFRSGTTKENLAKVNQNALLTSYNQQLQGMQGFARLPSNASQIAGGMAGIGQTLGQGQVAQGQADVAAQNQMFGDVAQLGTMAMAFSDSRLKDDIKPLGERNGHEWFSWTWNKAAEALGLKGKGEGVIADKVQSYQPDAVGERDGYLTVNYKMLGV